MGGAGQAVKGQWVRRAFARYWWCRTLALDGRGGLRRRGLDGQGKQRWLASQGEGGTLPLDLLPLDHGEDMDVAEGLPQPSEGRQLVEVDGRAHGRSCSP
jgi:hypothetical protein